MNEPTRVTKPPRRALQAMWAVLMMLALFVLPTPSWAAGGTPILLLADDATDGTTALVETLTAAGYEVEVVLPEFRWDATNPPLAGFKAVIHLNGPTFHTPLPVHAQEALVDFVRNGGGYIGGQFNGYEQAQGQQVDMSDLVLQLWPAVDSEDDCNECSMTWTVVPGQEAHPVLNGVPESFAFFADSHDAGPLVVFDEYPSVVLMTARAGGPAVTAREFGAGRVLSFSSATNTSTHETLLDFNILTLYVNAVDWMVRADEPLPAPQCNAPETITRWDTPTSFTATTDRDDLSVEITGYDCFFLTPGGKKIDKWRFCSASYFGDTITIDRAYVPGTHISWTAVSMDAAGNVSDETVCEVKVVPRCKLRKKMEKILKKLNERKKNCRK